jgi:hypothetical protein
LTRRAELESFDHGAHRLRKVREQAFRRQHLHGRPIDARKSCGRVSLDRELQGLPAAAPYFEHPGSRSHAQALDGPVRAFRDRGHGEEIAYGGSAFTVLAPESEPQVRNSGVYPH